MNTPEIYTYVRVNNSSMQSGIDFNSNGFTVGDSPKQRKKAAEWLRSVADQIDVKE